MRVHGRGFAERGGAGVRACRLPFVCGRLPGQFRGRELDEEVSGAADERLVREVLGDLGQQVVNHGHVALAVQHLLLPVQHSLSGGGQTRVLSEVRAQIRAEAEYLEDFLLFMDLCFCKELTTAAK